MKKGFILLGMSMLLLLGSSRLQAQQISLSTPNTPATPIGICQCDTLDQTSTREISFVFASNFLPSTTFHYELASPNNNWATADTLDIVSFRTNPVTNPVDTILSTNTKLVTLAIPCNAPLGPASLRIRSSNSEISDTLYYIINKIPDVPVIDSIAYGYPNPYTSIDDWGFCVGDSVTLYVEPQFGATYQWNSGGAPILGETKDSMVVKVGGVYSVTVDLGACDLTSKDTIINPFRPLTDIVLGPSTGVHQIDNFPWIGDRVDSIQFCETTTAELRAPLPPVGVPDYKYQWLTDSIDRFGDTIRYSLVNDTLRGLVVDTTGRYYVVVNDSFCVDTSAIYYVFVDSIPATNIFAKPFPGFGGPIHLDSVCMKDSIFLTAAHQIPTWQYQWQRLNTSTNTWFNLVDDTNATLVIDTTYLPNDPLQFYRLRTNNRTYDWRATCFYFTDTMYVRYESGFQLGVSPDPWVNFVGQDSINFCESDSATIFGPFTPGQLVLNGLNFSYQWMRDSLDTATSIIVRIPIKGETNRTFTVHETGKYYLATDDGICIDTTVAYNVFVDTIPSTFIIDTGSTGNGTLLCLSDSVVLLANDVVYPGWNYQWQQFNSTSNSWFTLPNDTLAGMLVDTSYKYANEDTAHFRLMINYINDFNLVTCDFITDSVTVVFFAPPTISFIPGDSLGVCNGDSILVVAQGNSFSYLWSTGDLTPSIWLSTPGTYTVEGTGINGCTSIAELKIYELVTVASAGPDVNALSGETVQLSGSGGTNFQWSANKPIAWSDFLSQDVSVSYTLPEGVKADTITIYLTVTNSLGCRDTDSLRMIVTSGEDPEVSLLDQAYNMFTPNGDGLNDVWDITPIVNSYGGCRIDIMNRWGSIVYQKEVFTGTWDGKDDGGKELPDGTYYYLLSCDGTLVLKKAITLIRNK